MIWVERLPGEDMLGLKSRHKSLKTAQNASRINPVQTEETTRTDASLLVQVMVEVWGYLERSQEKGVQ